MAAFRRSFTIVQRRLSHPARRTRFFPGRSLPPGGDILHAEQGHGVRAGKGRHLRQTGHAAVLIGQFAKYPAGLKTGQGHEVHRGFGMAATLQNAAGTRPQRKDMAGAAQIFRPGLRADGGLYRGHTISGGNAGGHPLGPAQHCPQRSAWC